MFVRKLLVLLVLSASGLMFSQVAKAGPEVAEGIILPPSGTIFGVDTVMEKPVLLQIHATEVSVNSHAGSNFARSAVYAGPHSTVELKGVNSAATFHVSQPVLYIRMYGEDPELMRGRIHLIRLKTSKDRRIVSEFSMNIFGGQKKREYDESPAEKSDFADSSWLKLTPQSNLEPGEYAVVVMPKDPSLIADAVYDFSIGGDRMPAAK